MNPAGQETPAAFSQAPIETSWKYNNKTHHLLSARTKLRVDIANDGGVKIQIIAQNSFQRLVDLLLSRVIYTKDYFTSKKVEAEFSSPGLHPYKDLTELANEEHKRIKEIVGRSKAPNDDFLSIRFKIEDYVFSIPKLGSNLKKQTEKEKGVAQPILRKSTSEEDSVKEKELSTYSGSDSYNDDATNETLTSPPKIEEEPFKINPEIEQPVLNKTTAHKDTEKESSTPSNIGDAKTSPSEAEKTSAEEKLQALTPQQESPLPSASPTNPPKQEAFNAKARVKGLFVTIFDDPSLTSSSLIKPAAASLKDSDLSLKPPPVQVPHTQTDYAIYNEKRAQGGQPSLNLTALLRETTSESPSAPEADLFAAPKNLASSNLSERQLLYLETSALDPTHFQAPVRLTTETIREFEKHTLALLNAHPQSTELELGILLYQNILENAKELNLFFEKEQLTLEDFRAFLMVLSKNTWSAAEQSIVKKLLFDGLLFYNLALNAVKDLQTTTTQTPHGLGTSAKQLLTGTELSTETVSVEPNARLQSRMTDHSKTVQSRPLSKWLPFSKPLALPSPLNLKKIPMETIFKAFLLEKKSGATSNLKVLTDEAILFLTTHPQNTALFHEISTIFESLNQEMSQISKVLSAGNTQVLEEALPAIGPLAQKLHEKLAAAQRIQPTLDRIDHFQAKISAEKAKIAQLQQTFPKSPLSAPLKDLERLEQQASTLKTSHQVSGWFFSTTKPISELSKEELEHYVKKAEITLAQSTTALEKISMQTEKVLAALGNYTWITSHIASLQFEYNKKIEGGPSAYILRQTLEHVRQGFNQTTLTSLDQLTNHIYLSLKMLEKTILEQEQQTKETNFLSLLAQVPKDSPEALKIKQHFIKQIKKGTQPVMIYDMDRIIQNRRTTLGLKFTTSDLEYTLEPVKDSPFPENLKFDLSLIKSMSEQLLTDINHRLVKQSDLENLSGEELVKLEQEINALKKTTQELVNNLQSSHFQLVENLESSHTQVQSTQKFIQDLKTLDPPQLLLAARLEQTLQVNETKREAFLLEHPAALSLKDTETFTELLKIQIDGLNKLLADEKLQNLSLVAQLKEMELSPGLDNATAITAIKKACRAHIEKLIQAPLNAIDEYEKLLISKEIKNFLPNQLFNEIQNDLKNERHMLMGQNLKASDAIQTTEGQSIGSLTSKEFEQWGQIANEKAGLKESLETKWHLTETAQAITSYQQTRTLCRETVQELEKKLKQELKELKLDKGALKDELAAIETHLNEIENDRKKMVQGGFSSAANLKHYTSYLQESTALMTQAFSSIQKVENEELTEDDLKALITTFTTIQQVANELDHTRQKFESLEHLLPNDLFGEIINKINQFKEKVITLKSQPIMTGLMEATPKFPTELNSAEMETYTRQVEDTIVKMQKEEAVILNHAQAFETEWKAYSEIQAKADASIEQWQQESRVPLADALEKTWFAQRSQLLGKFSNLEALTQQVHTATSELAAKLLELETQEQIVYALQEKIATFNQIKTSTILELTNKLKLTFEAESTNQMIQDFSLSMTEKRSITRGFMPGFRTTQALHLEQLNPSELQAYQQEIDTKMSSLQTRLAEIDEQFNAIQQDEKTLATLQEKIYNALEESNQKIPKQYVYAFNLDQALKETKQKLTPFEDSVELNEENIDNYAAILSEQGEVYADLLKSLETRAPMTLLEQLEEVEKRPKQYTEDLKQTILKDLTEELAIPLNIELIKLKNYQELLDHPALNEVFDGFFQLQDILENQRQKLEGLKTEFKNPSVAQIRAWQKVVQAEMSFVENLEEKWSLRQVNESIHKYEQAKKEVKARIRAYQIEKKEIGARIQAYQAETPPKYLAAHILQKALDTKVEAFDNNFKSWAKSIDALTEKLKAAPEQAENLILEERLMHLPIESTEYKIILNQLIEHSKIQLNDFHQKTLENLLSWTSTSIPKLTEKFSKNIQEYINTILEQIESLYTSYDIGTLGSNPMPLENLTAKQFLKYQAHVNHLIETETNRMQEWLPLDKVAHAKEKIKEMEEVVKQSEKNSTAETVREKFDENTGAWALSVKLNQLLASTTFNDGTDLYKFTKAVGEIIAKHKQE